jgi:hypothetical protein
MQALNIVELESCESAELSQGTSAVSWEWLNVPPVEVAASVEQS